MNSLLLLLTFLSLFFSYCQAGESYKPLFTYKDMCNRRQLSLNGGAIKQGAEIYITGYNKNEAGSLFLTTPINVVDGFTTTFTFNIQDGEIASGDGFAFVIQANQRDTIRAFGSGIGYSSMVNAVVVEFDTYKNGDGINDPNDNHVSLHTAYAPGAMVTAVEGNNFQMVNGIKFADGNDHVVVVTYTGASLEVTIDNSFTKSWPLTLANFMKLLNIEGDSPTTAGSVAFVGFTAGTGGDFESHHIKSWSFQNTDGVCATGFSGSNCELNTISTSELCAKLQTCGECSQAVACCSWQSGSCVASSTASTCPVSNPLIYWGIGLVCFIVVLSATAVFIYYRRSSVKSINAGVESDNVYSSL